MKSSDPLSKTLHADQEHEKLRTVVVLLLIFLFFISYWLIYTLLQLEFWGNLRDYAVSLSCVLGLVLALAVSAGIEAWLKRVWPSGHKLVLDDAGIHVFTAGEVEKTIRVAEDWADLYWQFELKGYRRGGREKRLPQNYICLACQLQQDNGRLIVHSYLPPQKAAASLNKQIPLARFHKIQPGDVYESSFSTRLGAPARPIISNEVLTGSDGRYWLAERHRWNEGFELTPHDFAIFMDYLAKGKSES